MTDGPDAAEADADVAVDLVLRAGALASQMRIDGIDVQHKSSITDVVTAADHAAEDLVTTTLRTERPDDGLLGEEGTFYEGTSGRRWVIDPVDGTYNFASGLSYWCSAVALEDRDGPVLGAVHQPITGETWIGGRDLPTSLNGEPLTPLTDIPLAECSIATYVHPPTIHDADVYEPWINLVRGAATLRVLGSGSCDLAAVAGGRIGAWAQHSCPEWDWLPGQALVEAAGGATAVIEHRGHRWHLAGNRRALDELAERLVTS